MLKIAYSIPAFIRSEDQYTKTDLIMLGNVLSTVQSDNDAIFIFYNQGCLNNYELESFLNNYDINYKIIGEGENVGIPKARQEVFQYVWDNYPEIPYQVEIHLDMLLYDKWYLPITDYLDTHEDEPCMSAAIINGFGGYSFGENNIKITDMKLSDATEVLKNTKIDKIDRGFNHPVIHKSNVLKEVGGIDLRFLKGGQGFEDYAILISYYNYLGTNKKWYPKANGNTTVFHNLLTQRKTLPNVLESIALNEEGLYQQFGAYGFKVLSEMLADTEYTGKIYEYRVNRFVNTNFQFTT